MSSTRFCARLSAGLLLLSPAGFAGDHTESRPHEHGAARLTLAIDQNRIEIELESPAMNLVGFEHAPHTNAQRAQIHAASAVLAQADHLVQFVDADCRQTHSQVTAPHTDTHAHEKHAHQAHVDTDADTSEAHSDFHVQHTLTCTRTDAIRTATVTLYLHFSGVDNVQVEWLSGRHQGAQQTTRAQPGITLE